MLHAFEEGGIGVGTVHGMHRSDAETVGVIAVFGERAKYSVVAGGRAFRFRGARRGR